MKRVEHLQMQILVICIIQINNLTNYSNCNIGLDYQMQQQQIEVNKYNSNNNYNPMYVNCPNWINMSEQISSNSMSPIQSNNSSISSSHYQSFHHNKISNNNQ